MSIGEALGGKRVFVTGHTGFKGSWLTLWLSRIGADVTGFSLAPPTQPNNFTVSQVASLLKQHHQGDVRDLTSLSAAIQQAEPDVVFHLAAQPLVRRSYDDPHQTFEVNVMGTANVLESVRNLKRPCVVIIITSDKCYENSEQVWGYRECDPLGGADPYSASKGAAEIIVGGYRRSFFNPGRIKQHGVKVASVRAGNVIGGGDWAEDRIIPDIVRALSTGRTVSVRNPLAVRPWQHVLEPLGGYLALASQMLQKDDPTLCDAWNFGPGESECVPVRELVATFFKSWGAGASHEDVNPNAVHEAHTLKLSIDKATRMLNWHPRWKVGEAIAHTAAWYHTYYQNKGSMQERCNSDIDAYESASA